MPRPTDWNAIGLSGDPTPGEPDQITRLADLFTELGGTARRIWVAIEAVMSNANDSVFVGEAADALRGKVDNRLRGHVEDVAWAFETSAGALREWATTVTEHQQRADSALASGRGLAEDDPTREQYTTTAREAGESQAEQGRSVAGRISAVSHISLPVSACKVFWEAFQWLAIILIIPALILGGPIALLALGVNLTLFIKTVVDFARGDATFLDLFLAGLGLIAPTTKGLPIFQIIKAGTKAFTQGLANFGRGALVLLRNLFTGGGFRFAQILPGMRDLLVLGTGWVRQGGLWVMRGVQHMPQLAGMVVQRGGLIAIQGVKAVPGLVRALPPALGRGAVMAWQGGRAGLGATWNFARAELGDGKWLRLLLPVDAREIGRFGLAKALKIGFFERGVLGQYRYGAALTGATGRAVSAAPIPTGAVDGLVDLPRFELAQVRLGDWAGQWSGLRPFEAANGPLHTALQPPALHLGPVGQLGAGVGDRAGLGFHASRQLDALVDMPAAQLGAVRTGGWANPAGRMDAVLGVSGSGAPEIAHPSGLYLPASAGAPSAVGHGAAGTLLPGAAHAGAAGVQAPPSGTVTVDLLALTRPGTTPVPVHTALTATAVTPPGVSATPQLLTPPAPGGTAGIGHTALTAVQAPPPGAHPALTGAGAPPPGTVGTADLLAPPPGGTVPGTAHPAVQAPHVQTSAGGGFSALDLVAGGRARPDVTVSGGAALADRTTSALTANHVRLHLDEFVRSPGPALPSTPAPVLSSAQATPPHPAGAATDRLGSAFDLVDSGRAGRAPGGGDHALAGAPGGHGAVVTPGDGPSALDKGKGRAHAGVPARAGAPLPPDTPAGVTGVPGGTGTPVVPAPLDGRPGLPGGTGPTGAPGQPHRLTPAQIEQLWARDSDRVDALFGAADDPLRDIRRDAWRDFSQARHDLGRARDRVRGVVGETSHGPGVHEIRLQNALESAGQHYSDTYRRLTDLGVEPRRVDQGMNAVYAQSLLEHPRLVAGMQAPNDLPDPLLPHGHRGPLVPAPTAPRPDGPRGSGGPGPDGVTHALDDAPLLPARDPALRGPGAIEVDGLLAGRADTRRLGGDAPAPPAGRTVPLTGFDGRPTGDVLRLGADGPGATPAPPRIEGPGAGAGAEVRDGRIRLTGPDGAYRDFDPADGRQLAQRTPLYGRDGAPYHGMAVDSLPGAHRLHQGGGRHFEVLDGGGFRVSDPATGRTVAFDAGGVYTGDGIRLRGPGGGFAAADRIVTAGGGGRVVTDLRGTPLPGSRPDLLDGGGIRVTDPATGVSVRFDARGIEVERGVALAEPGGRTSYVVAGGPGTGGHRLTDAAGGPLPGRVGAVADTGGFRVADGPGYQLYGPDGAHTGRGTALTGRDGNPAGYLDVRTDGGLRWIDDAFNPTDGRAAARGDGGRFEVALPGGGRQVFDPASGALLREVTPLPGGAGTRTEWAGHGSLRQGEFLEVRADGSRIRQGLNVIQDGRRTDFQYVVEFPQGGGNATWHRTRAGQRAVDGTFHHGKVTSYGPEGSWLRLDSSTGKGVEVFQRRVLPDGDVLDAFRRTDTVGFGHFNRRTVWTRWSDDGQLRGWGHRHYDTAGTGWWDTPHTSVGEGRSGLSAVREYRDGLQKYGDGAGHVIGVRDPNGGWTWHRYDGAGNELGSGRRTHERGGWTDTDADGAVVQRQWGSAHLPGNAGHFEEHRLVARDGGWHRSDLWERQSPHGKESGRNETLAPGVQLRTERLGEQRPPALFRNHFMRDVGHTPPSHAHLAGDSRFQMFLWSKEAPGAQVTGGARYVGMDGGAVDIGARGDFVRSTNKLHNGNTLKVGDHAPRPAHDPDAAARAWHESGGRPGGYRVDTPGSGRTLWEDRIAVQGSPPDQWPVAREGLLDGSVREYRDPPLAHQPRERGEWVTRDAHGNLTGIQHPSRSAVPAGQGDRFVRGSGHPDSDRWTWKLVDGDGADITAGPGPFAGRREFFRGSNNPALSWDDSFRDFDAAGNLVRERRMLDGGSYVDAWADGDRWLSAKYQRGGNAVDFGGGQQVRQWWRDGAWRDDWAPGARHWQDILRPDGAPGGGTVLRSVPTHGNGPLRVREFRADANARAADGVWKEFDHGSVVRQRKALSDGTFLETDAWRGQWRTYDANGSLVAQRTDSGLVFETRDGRLQLTGNEYDFRGQLTEVRGWGRRVREAQRMPWSGTPQLGESLYQPYWQTVAGKAALEFGQEFILEFGANLAVNGIVAAAQNKPFTGKDALKSFANAAVSAGIKTGVGTLVHENSLPLFRDLGSGRAGLANVDGGKHWNRRPMNHDKTWANEWGGNETATRWRGGTYDFGFGVGTSVLAGWVNGSMNAAVWGVSDANGNTVKLTGWDAVGDGGINALASLTTSVSTGLAKNIALLSTGGRLFHRQGFADFWLQLPFKIFEKSIQSVFLTSAYRASINPSWYQVPPPAPSPGPGTTAP
ncbi:hypothetical protein ABZ707_17860 [Streptomyces sp. NPDC006923]|uniref:hypothetical protein n=1 Tax=Streptomyces sp. NPDC006923 TaxID=3155355 RepID=UPI0033C24FC3